MNRKTPRIKPAFSVYLGAEPLASHRLAALDRIAGQYGVSRSQVIQMIADGELVLSRPPQDTSPTRHEQDLA